MAENPQNQAESGHFGCMAVSFCTCLLDCFLFWWYGGIAASKNVKIAHNVNLILVALRIWFWLKLAPTCQIVFLFLYGGIAASKKGEFNFSSSQGKSNLMVKIGPSFGFSHWIFSAPLQFDSQRCRLISNPFHLLPLFFPFHLSVFSTQNLS